MQSISKLLCGVNNHHWRNGPGQPCVRCGAIDELWEADTRKPRKHKWQTHETHAHISHCVNCGCRRHKLGAETEYVTDNGVRYFSPPCDVPTRYECDHCEHSFESPADCDGDACNQCDEGFVFALEQEEYGHE